METPHYVVLDTETTGLDTSEDRIIDLALVYLRADGSEIRRAESLINPGRTVPDAAVALTGVDPQQIAAAPPFSHFAARLAERLDGVILVGHNLPKFDARILAAEFARCGEALRSRRSLDTIRLWKTLEPQLPRFSLPELCASLGIAHVEAHRAMPDALATTELLRLIIARGLRPEQIQVELEPHYRARSAGNTEPATEGQVRRLKRLIEKDPRVHAGTAPAERLREILAVVGAHIDGQGFTITQEQIQAAYDQLAAR